MKHLSPKSLESLEKEKKRKEDESDKERESYIVSSFCPYFGFRLGAGPNPLVMTYVEENQCALKDINSFCHMEVEGDTPDWSGCFFNANKNWKEIPAGLEGVMVFPGKFRPAGMDLGEKMSLSVWMGYIARKKKSLKE